MTPNTLRTTFLCVALAALGACGEPTGVNGPGESASQPVGRVQFLLDAPLLAGNDPPGSATLDAYLAGASFSLLGEPVAASAWRPLASDSGFERVSLRLRMKGGPFVHPVAEAVTLAGLRPAAPDQRLPAEGELLLREQEILRVAGTGGPLSIDYPAARSGLADRLSVLDGDRLAASRLRVRGGERRAAFLPTPAHLTYQVDLAPGARLEFAVAAMPLSVRVEPGGLSMASFTDRVPTFRVRLEEEGGASAVLWERSLAMAESNEFHSVAVDLSAWAGDTVRLHFEAEQPAEALAAEEHVLVAWADPVVSSALPDARPNVLVLLLDTLRADRLGCYGNERDLTPSLDALAERGVRYADAMSAASWTLPSHASLFTSTYPSQHGLWKDQVLPAELSTIAEVLRAAGYRTAGFAEGGFLGSAHGFPRGHELYDSKNRDCSVTFDRAAAWIAERTTPYYAFVHTYQVHSPYEPPPEFRERFVRPYDGALPEVVDAPEYDWSHGGAPPSAEDQRYVSDLYDAEVAYLDQQVGRFLERLEAAGALENTLLLITSDHGEEFFEHGSALHGMSLYQEQLHVPLILAWPGHFDGGAVMEHAVHTIDVAPTIAAAAGVAPPPTWVGAALGFEASAASRPLFVPMKTLWSSSRRVGEPAASLREGDLKYVAYPADLRRFDEHPGAALFDLASDPGERHNLLDEAGAEAWSRKLEALYDRYPEVQTGGVAEHDEATRAELEKLGYAGGDE